MDRIYVVIEYNRYDAQPQGAFNTESEAYEAMHMWRGDNSTSNWVVKSCTLHK